MKTGLVLEGGGMRGLFTAGVLDVMMENDINVDGVVGVSAGALFGCNYVSRQIGRTLRYNMRLRNNPDYMGLRVLLKTGNIISTNLAYRLLPYELDIFDFETFRRSPVEFHLVVTDAERGIPLYRHFQDLDGIGMKWMRASASMPLVSRAVEIDGLKLFDGGVSDSIPLRYFQQQGYERNIVVLTQPKGYTKKKTKLLPLFRLFGRRYPQITACMARRHEMYNAQLKYIAEQEATGNTLVLCPERPLNIGRTELKAKKMERVYEMGRE